MSQPAPTAKPTHEELLALLHDYLVELYLSLAAEDFYYDPSAPWVHRSPPASPSYSDTPSPGTPPSSVTLEDWVADDEAEDPMVWAHDWGSDDDESVQLDRLSEGDWMAAFEERDAVDHEEQFEEPEIRDGDYDENDEVPCGDDADEDDYGGYDSF